MNAAINGCCGAALTTYFVCCAAAFVAWEDACDALVVYSTCLFNSSAHMLALC